MSEREKNAWNEIDEQAAREGSARRRELHGPENGPEDDGDAPC